MASVLSACIVLYHCGDELTHALRCIQNADLEVDVFLADNTPDDLTAEKMQWLFPGIRVLPQSGNIGFGRANNAVIPYLKSKYHLIMNPDVTFDPALLGQMVRYMEEHPNIAVLTPRVMNEDGTEQFLPKKRISVHYLLGGLLENFGGIFRRWRSEFTLADTDVKGPVEDSDLSRRILEENLGSIVYHPAMQVTHQWARENTRTMKGRMRQIRSVFKYFLKWGVTW